MIDHIQLSTLPGIRSLAKDLKKIMGQPHHVCLDKAAKRAGHSSYHSACKGASSDALEAHNNFISAHFMRWDSISRSYSAGRIVLQFALPKPIGELFSRYELSRLSDVYPRRLVSPDHITIESKLDNEEVARETVMSVARHLFFMLHTGLRRPIGKRRLSKRYEQLPDIPKADHDRFWVHSSNGAVVITDEPYPHVGTSEEYQRARLVWADTHGWLIRKTNFSSLWNPGQTDMYVAVERGSEVDLNKLIHRIESLDTIFESIDWKWGDGSFGEPLNTPLTTSRQLPRSMPHSARPAFSSHKTIPMSGWADSDRRPNGKTLFKTHHRLGRIMKSLDYQLGSFGEHSRVKSKLEDWMIAEWEHETDPDFDFISVYYRGIDENDPIWQKGQTSLGAQLLIKETIKTMERYYPDCAPLREMVNFLKRGADSLLA